jgi:hypothetical protein
VCFGPSWLLSGISIVCAISLVRGRQSVPRAFGCALGTAAPIVYALAVRRRLLNWGATRVEAASTLPGDDLVVDPVWQSTRAVTIAVPPARIWPWLAQMGQDRGGLYTYDWLENLAGLDFHSADRIHLEWQQVAIGDIVRLGPDQDSLVVAAVEPGHALVWRLLDPMSHRPSDRTSHFYVDASWAFVLIPVDAHHTRLIQRFRFGGRPRRLLAAFYVSTVEIPHAVMERRMLLGIRERVERVPGTHR